ncbi:Rieske (2Fe-2S) protein [Kocuria carniphila]|uniref:Cytochrome bc1 complex Rieske iron-sulfur subunit n=1 Tax=Kocuria carniphila TaxID=262208 RepID=A0ABV3UXH8_9MICC|nr:MULTISPECIES: Rieske (2Fe-2S) protein [Kocuria]MCT1802489.1 Rieske (2Fe-2S) protein [Kocuria carniphila]
MSTERHQPSDTADTSGLPTRRRVMGAAGLASVAAVGLSACGGSDQESSDPATPQAPTSPVDVAATSDVPVGQGLKVEKDGLQAVVGQPTEGTFKAFSPVCPHEGCVVNPANKSYVCPCHSSTFDMATGDVQGGPATSGLVEYPVTVQGDRIIVG